MMSATPDPTTPLLEPPGTPEPPPGGRVPAGTFPPLDARERHPWLARPGPDRVWISPPQLPPWPVVWLALDGGHEGGQADRAIHLWGLAVDDGRHAPRPEAITADFEDRGGRRAWGRFVARAGQILEGFPDARWVHGSSREKAWLRAYAAACDTPAGFLERLEEALFELLSRGVRRAVRLSPDSCSIRRMAGHAGFRRQNPDSGPAWSIVQYRRARASNDPAERERILREVAGSNADDLLTMRTVWRWMLEQGPKEYCG